VRLAQAWGLSLPQALALAVCFIVPIVAWGIRAIVSRVGELHAVLGNALSAFRDRDFGLRLAVRGDAELAELKRLYNELADAVAADRQELQQKEVLLDTILQRTPVAVVLLSAADRVIYSNLRPGRRSPEGRAERRSGRARWPSRCASAGHGRGRHRPLRGDLPPSASSVSTRRTGCSSSSA
jgi:hypothetical protein